MTNRAGMPVVGGIVLATAFVAASWGLYGGYLTDDSYIHFVYARNLAEGGSLSFNPGQPSYGSTSPLWVLLLGLGSAAGISTPVFAQASSLFFSAACILTLALMAGKIGTSTEARLLPPLALAVDPWFQRWSVSGMEVGLAAFLVLVGFYVVFEAKREPGRAALGGAVLGLAMLARPEVALLILLTGLWLLAGRSLTRTIAFGVGAAVPIVAWLTFAYFHFGTVVPNSFVVKVRQTPSSLQSALDSILILGASSALPVAIVGVGILMWVVNRSRRDGADERVGQWLVPGLWLAGAIGQYSYRGVNVASRYLCLFTPLLLMSAAWWMNYLRRRLDLWAGAARRLAVVWTAVLAAAVVQPLIVGALTWRSVKTAERSYSENHHRIADWLDENTREGAVVATYDVGIIAYRTRRPIVDLAGLTDTLDERVLRLSLQEKMRRGRPDYVVLQGKSEGEFLKRNPAFVANLTPIFSTEMYWGPGPQGKDVFTVYSCRW
jgi:hypothetical protein